MDPLVEGLKTTPDLKTSSDYSWKGAIGKGIELRRQFRTEHPELDSLPKRIQRELWSQFCGVNIPVVPSMEDHTREASCQRCRDGGWLYPVGKNGKTDYSKFIPCPECSSWDEEKKRLILKYSGIPEAKRRSTFASFQPSLGTEGAAEAAYLLSKGESGYKLLLIYGVNGNGKTHITIAACIEAKERGRRVRFKHFGELLSDLRRSISTTANPEEIIDDLKHADFLALDDIGMESRQKERGTNWQETVLEELVNYRYSHELPLICTTNKDLKQLAPAVLSRFKDASLSKMVLNTAPDYRGQKPKNRC